MLLTVKDLYATHAMMEVDDEEKAADASEWVQLAEDCQTDFVNIALLILKRRE